MRAGFLVHGVANTLLPSAVFNFRLSLGTCSMIVPRSMDPFFSSTTSTVVCAAMLRVANVARRMYQVRMFGKVMEVGICFGLWGMVRSVAEH